MKILHFGVDIDQSEIAAIFCVQSENLSTVVRNNTPVLVHVVSYT